MHAFYFPDETATAEPILSTTPERIMLGLALAGNPKIEPARRRWLDDMGRDDPMALRLAGYWSLFRAAGSEAVLPLIAQLGQAFYGWSDATGEGHVAFRDAILAEVAARCRQLGLSHTVALVNRGDRFDHRRHQSSDRGFEITRVRGWVVLRGDGSVYMRADVSLGTLSNEIATNLP